MTSLNIAATSSAYSVIHSCTKNNYFKMEVDLAVLLALDKTSETTRSMAEIQ